MNIYNILLTLRKFIDYVRNKRNLKNKVVHRKQISIKRSEKRLVQLKMNISEFC